MAAGWKEIGHVNPPTFQLRRLRADDEAAVLAFELENRGYFSRYINDRGDEFFERFSDRHRTCIDEQVAGDRIFHVLVEPGGAVIGRVNLFDVERRSATLGYRIAERVAGRGVATAAVLEVIALARERYGLELLRARVADANGSSRRVLEKAGFEAVGATELNGEPATTYERELRDVSGLTPAQR